MRLKPSPSLAIVIPVYNEALALPDALKSLQGLPVTEVIFVDGGSTDHTKQLIHAAGFVCVESTLGRAKQMNIGTQKSSSDIILYLHIDTTINSSNISSIKKTYNDGYNSGRFDIKFSNPSLTYRIISFFINIRSRLTKVSTGDQGIFVTRGGFDAVGGYPQISLMEDVAFAKRLRTLGKMVCLRDTLITSSRRWEQHGVFPTIWLMWKMRLLFWLGVSPDLLVKMYKDAR